jgi:hypothetical protein
VIPNDGAQIRRCNGEFKRRPVPSIQPRCGDAGKPSFEVHLRLLPKPFDRKLHSFCVDITVLSGECSASISMCSLEFDSTILIQIGLETDIFKKAKANKSV